MYTVVTRQCGKYLATQSSSIKVQSKVQVPVRTALDNHGILNARSPVSAMSTAVVRGGPQKLSYVVRVDYGRIFDEIDHVHFSDGSALNVDGTWKYGGRALSKARLHFRMMWLDAATINNKAWNKW